MRSGKDTVIDLGVKVAAPFRNRVGLLLARRVIRACARASFSPVKMYGRYLRIVLDPNEIRRRTNLRMRPIYMTIEGVAGERLRVNLNDHIGWRTCLDSIFDPVPVILADLFCGPSGVVLDVGANVGTTSIPVAFIGHQVVGVEPSPGILSDLSHSIALNSPIPYTVVNLAAASPETKTDGGYLELYSSEGNFGAGSLLKNWNEGRASRRVELTRSATLDNIVSFLNPGRIDFVKIDIEGFEYEALQGLQGVLEKDRPAAIFEWRPDVMIASQHEVRDLRELFPSSYTFFGVDCTHAPGTAGFTISLINFDPVESYENVMAYDATGQLAGRSGDLIANRELDYVFGK
jgi:FkbM family methyltransferase